MEIFLWVLGGSILLGIVFLFVVYNWFRVQPLAGYITIGLFEIPLIWILDLPTYWFWVPAATLALGIGIPLVYVAVLILAMGNMAQEEDDLIHAQGWD